MFKALLLTIVLVAIASVLNPDVIVALSWILAFLILLMVGDLLRSYWRTYRRRIHRA